MDESRQSDASLMTALQEGSSAAMSILVERWQPRLLGFVYRYIQNETVARDLVEETFVRLYLSRDRFDPERNFSTWLFGIAANLCRNQYRWWKRRRETSLAEAPETADDRSPAEQAARRDRDTRLAAAIQALPHALRSTLLLYYFSGLSYTEIAQSLGCSVRGVESRLYRARQRLGKSLSLPAAPMQQPAMTRPGLLEDRALKTSTTQ